MPKVSEGDAGKELVSAQYGAAGTYVLSIGGQALAGTVRQGTQLTDTLGTVSLEPGNNELRVSAREISGQELMRLRSLVLRPVSR